MIENSTQIQFNRGALKPFECLQEGWALIKGQYWLFLGITVVGVILGSLLSIVLMGPTMCGIYFCLFKHMSGERVRFEDLFRGFDFFLQSFIATLIVTIPVIVIMVPLYLFTFFSIFMSAAPWRDSSIQPAPSVGAIIFIACVWILAMALMLLILGVFSAFTYPLIVDRKLSGIDALKTSVSAAMANLGGLVLLVIINMLLSFVGLLFCYVGVFFVLPVTMAALAIAYRRVFPTDAVSGNHSV